MLLNSVIIILREVLEGALLFSVLLALSKQSVIQQSWIFWSFIIGLLGAVVYGLNMGIVSEWFDGVGQEVMNALIQLVIYTLLVLFISLQFKLHLILKKTKQGTLLNLQEKPYSISSLRSWLIFFMIVISALAIIREGSEMLLYFFSVTRSKNYYSSIIMGMTMGASIGISIGFLFYYLLVNLSQKGNMIIALSLLILVSSGMMAQAVQLLIQADWLPAQLPLWDSSFLLSEKSVTGQLMYVLIGYESTPTAIQAILYVCSLILPILIMLYIWKTNLENKFL